MAWQAGSSARPAAHHHARPWPGHGRSRRHAAMHRVHQPAGRSVVRPRPRPRGLIFTWGTVNRVVSPIHMGFVNYLGLVRVEYQHQHGRTQHSTNPRRRRACWSGLRSCPLLLSPPSVRRTRTPQAAQRRAATGAGGEAETDGRPLKWQRARWCGHVSCCASHVLVGRST
jgi:hypothetical protein